MKTWNSLTRAGTFAALLVLLTAVTASAQTVTLMSTQDFSSSTFPPSGWSSSGFYWTSYGSGGANGSAYCDVWGVQSGPLSTPAVDASAYAKAGDSVWVDYDFYWEYNGYCNSFTQDTYKLSANSDVLVSGNQSSLYTYYAPSDNTYYMSATAENYFTHYHVLIPVGDRTSSMKINFGESAGWGCSDFAIDNVKITAFAKPPGEFSLLPKSLNFGVATPNSPDTLYATAYGVGVGAVHITGVSLSGSSAFHILSGPQAGDSVISGGSKQFAIQFLPLNAGSLTGQLAVYTDAADSGTQYVNLKGIGAVPSVSYGGVTELFRKVDVKLGDTSQPLYIPVTSTGIAPLHFNSFYFIGLNPNNYYISHFPQNPLPPDGVDSIGVTFTPTLEGRPDAQLVINSDAANIPWDTVKLFGIGKLPALVITVPPPGAGNLVNFDSVALGDSVCQTIQLTNPGTDTLHILKQLVTYGDYDFSFYPLTGGDTAIVPGGGTQLVNICFKPLKAGSRFANIRFYTDIPHTFEKPSRDTSQFLIDVTGVGVPFGHLVAVSSLVDTAIVGDTQCIDAQVENNGQADLTVNSVSLRPAGAHFKLNVATPFTLQPGESRMVSLCFAPQTRASEFDTLVFMGTTAEQSLSQSFLPTGVGVVSCVSADSALTFGATGMTMVGATDTSCITVTNCGDIATAYTASAPTGMNYTLEPPATSAVVPAGGTATFCVVFAPDSIGTMNGTVTITGGANATTTMLSGVGAGVLASASGSEAKPVTLGTCDTFAVQVTNNGNVPWMPGTGSITGANASDFHIVSGPTPATVAPGASATMMISFCASQNGTESMTLTFPSSAPTPIKNFSYSTSAIGTSEGVTMRTEQDGFSIGPSYPNPTNGSADITVTLPYESPVRIDLIDATGALVKTAFQGRLAGGSQIVSLDAKGLASGTYFVQLSSGDVRLTRQMSIIK